MSQGNQRGDDRPAQPGLPARQPAGAGRGAAGGFDLTRRVGLAGAALTLWSGGLLAQEPAGTVSGRPHLRGQVIAWFTSQGPVPESRSGLAEVRLIQPVLGVDLPWARGRVLVQATLNLEGLAIPNGELGVGTWGEGFIDRRHPHTYVHEVMVSWRTAPGRRLAAGLGAGKGFATFGSDDPMSRPAVRYPVNHHWAQVLERALAFGQVRYGRLTLEGSLFNGDEPERPGQWPNLDRVGDSWALRALLAPGQGLELQASTAGVASPEHREGAGPTQRKWSASLRGARNLAGGRAYGLAEWARTEDAGGAFAFTSVLVEGAIRLGAVRPYYRYERTTRPEEERIGPFRSRRPHLEDAILGTSRWSLHTAGAEARLAAARGLTGALILEVTAGTIARGGPGLFQVSDWYHRPEFWSLSLGLRIGAGMEGHRMGRYGLLAAGSANGAHHQ